MIESVSDLHIDDFCKDTAKILLMLYKRFPTKTVVYVEDIAGPDEPDEFGLHSPRFEAGFSALVWLKEQDYIAYSGAIKQEAVEDACLSHRGFILMSSIEQHPISLDDQKPPAVDKLSSVVRRIDRLRHTLRHGSSEAIKELILHYMILSRELK
ncbi:hypothetical protein [Agarilytica rhodophyticola]|uniref:hypothetical protein n=1 Tax=Agarilytica rhodophyticola TaxID=1737490 RepID=UPI000B34889D|nr:hypothetical protein [Agarilytica rhodophyticola]